MLVREARAQPDGALPGQVLEKLRFLSCLQISEATLRESGVVSACPALQLLRAGNQVQPLLCAGKQVGSSVNSVQGFSVRKQKHSANGDVAALAARIVSKWQGIVLDERQARKGSRAIAPE